MLDIRDEIDRWRDGGVQAVAAALLVDMRGSGVRLPGALFAVADDGRIAGSVSGGCIEPGLIEEADSLLEQSAAGAPDSTPHSAPFKLVRFDQSGGRLLSRLAPCSESVEIALFRLDLDVYAALCGMIDAGDDALFTLKLDGAAAGVHAAIAVSGAPVPGAPETGTRRPACEADRATISGSAGRREFRYHLSPPPRLVIVGASHVAQHLARLALDVGVSVSVVDPRPRFLTADRFPSLRRRIGSHAPRAFADLAVGAGTAVCALSHDDKIDDAAIIAALQRDAWYVGALGSRATHAERCSRLLESGVDADALERIHAPIGLSIGAASPAEIALSILGELVSGYRKRMPKRVRA